MAAKRSRATSTRCCWRCSPTGRCTATRWSSGCATRSGGQFELPEGTVYPALHRLEADGLLAQQLELGERPAPAGVRADPARPPGARRAGEPTGGRSPARWSGCSAPVAPAATPEGSRRDHRLPGVSCTASCGCRAGAGPGCWPRSRTTCSARPPSCGPTGVPLAEAEARGGRGLRRPGRARPGAERGRGPAAHGARGWLCRCRWRSPPAGSGCAASLGLGAPLPVALTGFVLAQVALVAGGLTAFRALARAARRRSGAAGARAARERARRRLPAGRRRRARR